MKNLFLPAIIALSGLSLKAQTHDHALGFGFNTSADVVCALTDGRFLAAGTGVRAPGELFADTVFAVIYNTDGQITQRILVPAPNSEVHSVIDALALPDGGFMLSTNSTLCDVINDQTSLFSYGPDGLLRWQTSGSFGFSSGQMALTPDSAVACLGGDQIIAYDYQNGDVLWSVAYDPNQPIYDLAFIPGTEDFAAVGYPHMQVWRQTGPPGSHDYALQFSESLPPYAYVNKVLARPEGNFTYDNVQKRFVRFDENGYAVLGSIPFYVSDFAQVDDGFWFIGWKSDFTKLLKTNLQGQVVDSLTINDSWLTGLKLAFNNTSAGIAGISGSGPESIFQSASEWPRYQAGHLWLRTFDPANPTETLNESNATLKSVQQFSPVETSSITFQFPPFTTLYNLSGGDFRVEVTNFGANVLNQVDVLISFGFNQFYDICFMKPAVRRHYDNLGLAPGQSVWLDFGDIEAEGQFSIPTEYCFWTAAPNEMPDIDHYEDAFCHTIVLDAHPAGEASAGLRLFPNPAGNEGFSFVLPENNSEIIDYQMFDATGRLMRQGKIAAGQNGATVPTAGLSPGLYFLRVGKWLAKVVLEP